MCRSSWSGHYKKYAQAKLVVGPISLSVELPHIFDRFHRGDKSRARPCGGIRLGLAIAETWIEVMHGEIGVESKPGHGSRFWFTLSVVTDEKTVPDMPHQE